MWEAGFGASAIQCPWGWQGLSTIGNVACAVRVATGFKRWHHLPNTRECLRITFSHSDKLVDGGDSWWGHSQFEDDPGSESLPITALPRVLVPAPLHTSKREVTCRKSLQWK
jgi:hypothetical protein